MKGQNAVDDLQRERQRAQPSPVFVADRVVREPVGGSHALLRKGERGTEPLRRPLMAPSPRPDTAVLGDRRECSGRPCAVLVGLPPDGLVATAPQFVTPYYRAGRRPFLILSDRSDGPLALVLAELSTSRERAASHRRFGPRYVPLRRATEARARDLFTAAGGRPKRLAPHYFVLGASSWFAGLYADTREVRLPVVDLPAAASSFTCADSITALGLGAHLGVPVVDAAHRGRVYRLDHLTQVIARHGLPDDASPGGRDGYEGHQHRPVDQYVEVQLWSDDPIREYLADH